MKTTLCWMFLPFALLAGLGFPRDDAWKTLRDDFRTPPPGYGEVPFWWWTGDTLNKDRLLAQIEALHAAGISGTQVNYAHRRSDGWKTEDVEPAIFSDAWWDMFNFVAEESAKRGMGVGLSGYTLDWPGNDNLFRQLGISADDTRAHHLAMRHGPSAGGRIGPFPDAFFVAAAAFREDDPTNPVPLAVSGGTLPPGRWDIRVITAPPADATLDPLNPASAQRLIDRFLGAFERRLSPLGRSALNYFFQDELRLGRRGATGLWCDDFAAEFQKRKGYDARPWLSALFQDVGPKTAQVRLDLNDVQVALTEERYFKPIYAWHAKRGLIYACDPSSRGKDPTEFGDYMRSMRWYTAPGFDTPGTSADVIKNKMGSSIAHLYRRPRVWVEGYHSQGWQASTSTIFDSTVHNFVYGASLLNLHGLYYSTYGGWWEWAPPCYHFRMPYWQHMPGYLKYFERLSYALSQGTHVADVAVLSPVEPMVVDRAGAGAAAVKRAHALVEELVLRRSVDADFIDGDSVRRASIADGRLVVAGERYRMVVLADRAYLRPEVRAKLDAFAKAGGLVAMADMDAPRLVSMLGPRDFEGPADAKVLHRAVGAFDLYYLVDVQKGGACTFRASGSPETWDPWTGTQKRGPVAEPTADGRVRLTLPPSPQPVLLVFSRDGAPLPPAASSAPRTTPVLTLAGPWKFTLEPTLDNTWGDFRLPATREKLGAEIRRFRSDLAERTDYETVTFGPQFRNMATGKLHDFSWRWGEEGRPAYQNWHHGLNRKVGDDFFSLGPYDAGWGGAYSIHPTNGPAPDVAYETFVYAPAACPVRLEAHGVAPVEMTLDGKAVTTQEVVQVAAGYRPLRIRYRGTFGRAALVVRRQDVAARPSTLPLSSRWCGDPSILKFDPFGGRVKETAFTATVPPGFAQARMELAGELVEATCAGERMRVRHEGTAWTAALARPCVQGGALTLRVRPQPGAVGCGVFCGVVKLACAGGEMALGDWARFEGLRCYSGGAVYEKAFVLTEAQAAAETLDLGRVAATCDVAVNGGAPQIVCTPPWCVNVKGRLRAGANTVRIRVFNTLNNHYQTIPTRYKKPVEEVPSGLLGPVTLVAPVRQNML